MRHSIRFFISSWFEPSSLFIMQHGDGGVSLIPRNIVLMMSAGAVMGVQCERDGAEG